jgi:hypothetical protein
MGSEPDPKAVPEAPPETAPEAPPEAALEAASEGAPEAENSGSNVPPADANAQSQTDSADSPRGIRVEGGPRYTALLGDFDPGERSGGSIPGALQPDPNRGYAQVRWVFHEGDQVLSAEFTAEDLRGRKSPVGGFHVSGTCPACTHETTSIFPLMGVVTGPGNVLAGTAAAAGDRISALRYAPPVRRRRRRRRDLAYGSIHCNCVEFHDKANGKFGCGAYWLLGADVDPGAGQHAANPALHVVDEGDMSRYWPAAEAVATATPNALTIFQSRAAAWQTGVTGVVTVAGLAALLADRTAIHGLRAPWDLAVIAAIIAATAASAVNIAIALWVNVGFPSVKPTSGASTLADADLAPLSRATWASSWLRRGTWAAAAAFAFGFFGVAAFIATPDQGAGDTKVSITLYQATPTTAPTPSPGSTATSTVTPGAAIEVTTTASPVCAVIQGQQPTPPASPGGTPVINVVEPSATPSPSQATAIPVASIAAVSPGCP